ncbi:MAG: two-component system, OmpR family, sensor histidine kinase MtrB, partial [Acidimicrobiaceae bacterium]|nr:two-component system, OmpR family, sensor histidine kinase MtrB [Acidimicrobiaceae bacterium]
RHGAEPVELWAQMTPDDDVEIHVADRGPGVGRMDVSSMPGSVPRRGDSEPGSLGLYLVYRLAASLGGTLELADRPGGGAMATLRLPQRRGADPRS